jgi:hypothetical protein
MSFIVIASYIFQQEINTVFVELRVAGLYLQPIIFHDFVFRFPAAIVIGNDCVNKSFQE